MDKFYKELNKEGIRIKADYYCKHAPEEKCGCRKPETGLIEKAIDDLDIDVTSSFFIGDKTADILAGKRSGLKTVLVKTGKGGKDKKFEVIPDYYLTDLLDFAKTLECVK